MVARGKSAAAAVEIARREIQDIDARPHAVVCRTVLFLVGRHALEVQRDNPCKIHKRVPSGRGCESLHFRQTRHKQPVVEINKAHPSTQLRGRLAFEGLFQ